MTSDEEFVVTIDFHANLNTWIPIEGTNLEVQAKDTDELGVLHFRKLASKAYSSEEVIERSREFRDMWTGRLL